MDDAERNGPWWPLVAGLSVLCACSAPEFTKPQPPDMSELLESYQSPTGSFDPGNAEELGVAVTLFDEVVGDTDIVGRVTDLLSEVIEPVTAAQRRAEPEEPDTDSDSPYQLSIRADGYVIATRICPGWTLPSVVDPGNGKAVVTATFSEEGLDPVVWGSVTACRYRVSSTRIQLTPSSARDAFRVYWGENVRRETLTVGALLSLALRADIDGSALDLDLDVRLADEDALEYLMPTGGGSVVVRANADGTFAVRSSEGSFECDETFDCESDGQGSVDDE
jgi:hypothetical protein